MISSCHKLLGWILCMAHLQVLVNGLLGSSWNSIKTPRREIPRNLHDARQLHLDATFNARKQMMKRGHAPHSSTDFADAGDTSVYSNRVHQRRMQELNYSENSKSPETSSSAQSISPLDCGADPSGKTDSTDALLSCMAKLLNASAHGSDPMADKIVNLGGATLDLSGGEYLISAPLVIPKLVGNVRITGGTLKASPAFDPTKFLIEIGEAGCNEKIPQGVCNEFIELDSIFFDSFHVAAGGVFIANTMGATVGPSVFFTGFNDAAVRVHQGHEMMLLFAWMAETYWDDKNFNHSASHSIGVDLQAPDNYINNVIVFDYTHTGVAVHGPANVLTAVHTWNGGGIGILVNETQQVRLLGCYLDYNTLTLVHPFQHVVRDSFFLNTNAVIAPYAPTGGWIPGGSGPLVKAVVFNGNTYALDKSTGWGVNRSIVIELPSTNGSTAQDLPFGPAQCSQFFATGEISDNPMSVVQTQARQTQTQTLASEWFFDFSEQLLFPWIESVEYSMTFDDESDMFVPHAALSPSGTTVRVHTQRNVSATVTVNVAQCL
eukprot:m.401419 g.401419  ORF g.401419 m.401419 type:complete len:547 (-) comp21165_c0_seq9:182-1822(-)